MKKETEESSSKCLQNPNNQKLKVTQWSSENKD
jgi:hypothetical protein